MTGYNRWTSEEHRTVQMLRQLQDEISHLKKGDGDAEETQLFRAVVDTALAADTVNRTVYTGSDTQMIPDDSTSRGADLGDVQ